MTAQRVQVKLEIGHRASIRKKPTEEGFTHDWIIFVRGPEGSNIQFFVEKVIFYLHESFPNSKRVLKEPPYSVEESGYAGFLLPIEVYFKNKDDPRKIRFQYDLFLNGKGTPPVNHIRCEKLTFQNPVSDFRDRLLKAGGFALDTSAKDVKEEIDVDDEPRGGGRSKSSGPHTNKSDTKESKSHSGKSHASKTLQAQRSVKQESKVTSDIKPPVPPKQPQSEFMSLFGAPIIKGESVTKKPKEKPKPKTPEVPAKSSKPESKDASKKASKNHKKSPTDTSSKSASDERKGLKRHSSSNESDSSSKKKKKDSQHDREKDKSRHKKREDEKAAQKSKTEAKTVSPKVEAVKNEPSKTEYDSAKKEKDDKKREKTKHEKSKSQQQSGGNLKVKDELNQHHKEHQHAKDSKHGGKDSKDKKRDESRVNHKKSDKDEIKKNVEHGKESSKKHKHHNSHSSSNDAKAKHHKGSTSSISSTSSSAVAKGSKAADLTNGNNNDGKVTKHDACKPTKHSNASPSKRKDMGTTKSSKPAKLSPLKFSTASDSDDPFDDPFEHKPTVPVKKVPDRLSSQSSSGSDSSTSSNSGESDNDSSDSDGDVKSVASNDDASTVYSKSPVQDKAHTDSSSDSDVEMKVNHESSSLSEDSSSTASDEETSKLIPRSKDLLDIDMYDDTQQDDKSDVTLDNVLAEMTSHALEQEMGMLSPLMSPPTTVTIPHSTTSPAKVYSDANALPEQNTDTQPKPLPESQPAKRHKVEKPSKRKNKKPNANPEQNGTIEDMPIKDQKHDDYTLLQELQKRIMGSRNQEVINHVVMIILSTGLYNIGEATFDFDLCSLDQITLHKLMNYMDVGST